MVAKRPDKRPVKGDAKRIETNERGRLFRRLLSRTKLTRRKDSLRATQFYQRVCSRRKRFTRRYYRSINRSLHALSFLIRLYPSYGATHRRSSSLSETRFVSPPLTTPFSRRRTFRSIGPELFARVDDFLGSGADPWQIRIQKEERDVNDRRRSLLDPVRRRTATDPRKSKVQFYRGIWSVCFGLDTF